MRLLNVKTQKFEDFYGDNVPPYAILSHRWGDEEVTFQDIKSGRLSGWRKSWSRPVKLEGCRLQAKKDNLSYIWIDTCCIDKTNSAELAEAINSMFAWYKNAARCYAYLSDVRSFDDPQEPQSMFRTSSWFTRGWTLQELLAPKELHFYDSKWEPIGTKSELSSIIGEVTRIPRAFLIGWAGLHEASVAQRMSWAANRVTTRTEDIAYCLLGLFGVTMPMIYGEKEQAFVRLQLEIMKNSDDHSILAWGFTSDQYAADGNSLAIPGGALATSPANFADSGGVCIWNKQQTTNSFEFLGGSLRMQVPLVRNSAGQVFGLLNCSLESDKEKLVGIPLDAVSASESTDNYLRPAGRRSSLFPQSQMQHSALKLICIRRDLQASESKSVARRNCFYVEESAAMVKLIDVVPKDRWMEDKSMIMTLNDSRTETREEIFLRFRPTGRGGRGNRDGGGGGAGDDFVVVLVFELQEPLARGTGHVVTLSRSVPLAELAENFKDIKIHLYGQQSCSNGQVGVAVSVKQETVAGEGVFVVKLITLGQSSGFETKTVNATQQLVMLRQRRENERLRRVLESEQVLDYNHRQELDSLLRSTPILLHELADEQKVIQRAARDAQFQLNDAREQLQKAKKLVDMIDNDRKIIQHREEKLRRELVNHEEELQRLQLRVERRQKDLEKLIRESGVYDETEDESDFNRKLKPSNQEIPEIKAYMARMRLRRGIEIVKLANRIEALKMADDDSRNLSNIPKGAIIHEVVLAKVWEMKWQQRLHEVVEQILRAEQSTSRGIHA
jgi:hypothetical protein